MKKEIKLTQKEYLVAWRAVCRWNKHPFTSVLKGKLYDLSHQDTKYLDNKLKMLERKMNDIMYN